MDGPLAETLAEHVYRPTRIPATVPQSCLLIREPTFTISKGKSRSIGFKVPMKKNLSTK